jgi:mitochondrial distribution and morphology protein 12
MSVALDWSKLDDALAAKVRDFLNERLRNAPLPSILKSIQVVSFEFGSTPPTIEIQDITDPHEAFYEESYDEDDDAAPGDSEPPGYTSEQYHEEEIHQRNPSISPDRLPRVTSYVEGWAPPYFPQGINLGSRTGRGFPPFFNATAGIVSSGITTPNWMPGVGLSSYAPSRSFASSTVDAEVVHSPNSGLELSSPETSTIHSFRPRSDTIDTMDSTSPRFPRIDSFSRPGTSRSTNPSRSRTPEDVQIIAKITYDGNPRAQIQAELDFNYPSSSFISLPIRLTLTGLSFSGLALIASINNRVHFCLLEDEEGDDENWEHMLRDIHLESEIGERGKGVLKNVGKVERFLLEQGRRIISEEFVFPSFYTFIL